MARYLPGSSVVDQCGGSHIKLSGRIVEMSECRFAVKALKLNSRRDFVPYVQV